MEPFAGLFVMAVTSYVVYRWAMVATSRFFRLAVERGLLVRRANAGVRANTLAGILIRNGEGFAGLRALLGRAADPDVDVARKTALGRWILAPVMVILAGAITWVSLFAIVG